MRSFVRYVALVAGLLLAPLGQAGEALTLDAVKSRFSHAEIHENSASVLYDGWKICFLSHDGRKIGAALVAESEGTEEHSEDISKIVSRIATLAGMQTPESMEFEGKRPSALLVDQAVLGNLASEVDHVFSGSPLAAMAYLLDKEFFVIHDICKDGSLHWKTARKSGVELRMPMGEEKLSAIEVNGKQQMNEFAAGVLANKLGLGMNNVPENQRESLSRQLSCKEVPYMNAKSNILLARASQHTVIGRRAVVAQMLKNRRYGAISFPEEPSSWPVDKKEVLIDQPPPPAKQSSQPAVLSPEAAREAYIKEILAL